MNKMQAKEGWKALACIFGMMLFTVALYGQSKPTTQSTSPTQPAGSAAAIQIVPIDDGGGGGGGTTTITLDGGVPEVSVTDGTTITSTDINGVETTSPDTTTLAPGSDTVASTSLSSSTTTSTTTSSFALGPAFDPGPRPTGNQFLGAPAGLKGSTFAGTLARLLTVGVRDFNQPADAIGNEGAGNILQAAGVSFWGDALAVFSQLSSVDGAPDALTGNPTIKGLGPAFNADSCFTCHSQPTIGGTSPSTNPQLAVAHALGATNSADLSRFLRLHGPVREARFIFDADDISHNNLDGGVHELFSIQGRSDASTNCRLAQPNFNGQINNHNVIFRIPVPTFGEGLAENVTEADLVNNLANFAADKASFHIAGRFNRNGNDGTISRFGWKAQNKSMLLFSGEAANVEMGVTNEIFQNEKVPGLSCALNGTPEDNTHVLSPGPGNDAASTTSLVSSAIENFALFMRLNGAPGQCAFNSGVDANGAARCIALNDTSSSSQTTISQQIARGKQLFGTPSNGGMGCVLCHSSSLTTGTSDVLGLSNRTFAPFSDFALHHMGATLADGVNQGLAGPDEFRTAPLWGLGQRLFFLHDGRAVNLLQAIEAHYSNPNICFTVSGSENLTVNGHNFLPATSTQTCGSEANEPVRQFNALSVADKTAVLEFLRSL